MSFHKLTNHLDVYGIGQTYLSLIEREYLLPNIRTYYIEKGPQRIVTE